MLICVILNPTLGAAPLLTLRCTDFKCSLTLLAPCATREFSDRSFKRGPRPLADICNLNNLFHSLIMIAGVVAQCTVLKFHGSTEAQFPLSRLATVTTRRSATKVTLHINGVRESSPVDLQLSHRFTSVYRLAPGSLLGPGESETKAGPLNEQYCVSYSTLVCIGHWLQNLSIFTDLF